MKKNKQSIIICFAVGSALLLLVLVLIFLIKPAYNWDSNLEPQPDGSQPYDLSLFDEYMQKVLPKGYEVVQIAPVDKEDDLVIKEIAEAPIEKSLLVIYNYSWRFNSVDEVEYPIDEVPVDENDIYNEDDEDNEEVVIYDYLKDSQNIDVIVSAMKFARRGGSMILVLGGGFNPFYETMSHIKIDLEYSGDGNPYSSYSLSTRADTLLPSKTALGTPVPLRSKYVPIALGRALEPKDCFIDEFDGEISIVISGEDDNFYAADITFNKAGGHLYLTTLYTYFTNMGLLIPDGDNVRGVLVDRISKRPVRRLSYPKIPLPEIDIQSQDQYARGVGNNALERLKDNPGLWTTWLILLAAAVCLLVKGLMRRHPVTFDPTDIDPTAIVTERRRRFRHSPLLTFMFQTSWLYNKRNHFALFIINYHRLSRMVSRRGGVELTTANDLQLERVAADLSDYTGLHRAEILADLKWMRDLYLNRTSPQSSSMREKINKKEYSQSQTIVEKYPFA